MIQYKKSTLKEEELFAEKSAERKKGRMEKQTPSLDSQNVEIPGCLDPSHQNLAPEEQKIHQLIHQGMASAEAGQYDQADVIYAQALTLAEAHDLPQWQAQAIFGQGAVLDHRGEYMQAIPFFEKALSLFKALESRSHRMEINVSIFLANMLSKTGAPARALPILQHARQLTEDGRTSGQLPSDEYEYDLYGLYRELGCAHRELKQWEEAHQWYQQALEMFPLYAGPREISALHQAVLQFYLEQNDVEGAQAFGERTLALFAPSLGFSQEIRANIAFQLGLLCLQNHHSYQAIHYSLIAFVEMQQWRKNNAIDAFGAEPLAFLGRVCVNIGSGYGGIADSFARYATLLAYWRCGEYFLSQVEAEDVQVPRDNITGLQRICTLQIGPQGFASVQQASEPLYQELLAALNAPEKTPGPLLSTLLQGAEKAREAKVPKNRTLFDGTA